jgi:uncharacterized protein (DUF433 family)
LIGRDHPKGQTRATFHPLIKPAGNKPLLVSFYNLTEVRVLRALRTEHGMAFADLGKAIAWAEKKLDIERLMLNKELNKELRPHAGEVFLDRYVELTSLSAPGQLAMRKLFEDHLQRAELEDWQFPVRLCAFSVATQPSNERVIAIDPKIAFGRPIVRRAVVSTAAIADRIDARESVAAPAQDCDLTVDDIEQAVVHAQAA